MCALAVRVLTAVRVGVGVSDRGGDEPQGRTLPGRAGDDGHALIGDAELDECAAADRGECQREPQQRGAQRQVRDEVPPVWCALPVQLLACEVVLGPLCMKHNMSERYNRHAVVEQ